jgi:hypothetical protein
MKEKGKSTKGLKITLAVVSLLLLASVAAGLYLLRDHFPESWRSSRVAHTVIAGQLNLVKKVSEKNGSVIFETVRQLPFGAVVEVSRQRIDQDGKIYRRCHSYTTTEGLRHECERGSYLETASVYDIDNRFYAGFYPERFPVTDTHRLPALLKYCLMDLRGDYFRVTQDPNRINRSIIKADFNLDGEDDYAVVMQDAGGIHKLFIMCYDPDKPVFYEVYSRNHVTSSIRLLNRGDSIYIDGETLQEAPNIGIISQSSYEGFCDNNESVVFYDPESNKFAGYLQCPISKFEEYENAGIEPDEGETEEDSGETANGENPEETEISVLNSAQLR